jgi:diguanylate cyclase (GGDEF)-like protein
MARSIASPLAAHGLPHRRQPGARPLQSGAVAADAPDMPVFATAGPQSQPPTAGPHSQPPNASLDWLWPMIEGMPMAAAVAEGERLRINAALAAMVGHRPQDVATLDAWFAALHGLELAPRLRAAYEAARARGFPRSRVVEGKRADGTRVHFEICAGVAGPDTAVWFIHDVTERERAAGTLRIQVQRQTAIVALGRRALDPAIPLPALFEEATERLCITLGAERAAVLDVVDGGSALRLLAGAGLEAGVSLGDRMPIADSLLASSAPVMGSKGLAGVEAQVAGEPFALLAVSGAGGDVGLGALGDGAATLESFAHLLAGAVERASREAAIRHEAVHDALTGLPNRALLLDRLEQALHRRDGGFAVLFLDVDHFKDVNDSFGHELGDQLLVAIADRLRTVVREGDTVARFGGDEFVVLCEGVQDALEAAGVAERVASAFVAPFRCGAEELYARASIGVALPGESPDAAALLRDADAALYQAKELGRARWTLFDDRMRRAALERLRTETDLRRALERSELVLHYQPVVRLADQRIEAAEALVRWQHPERGLLGPGAFIRLAEDSGLIVPLGSWVIEETCRQIADWDAAGACPDVVVSVNLAARQLLEGDLAEVVAGALERHGVAPERLAVEITETVLVQEDSVAASVLKTLRDIGVRVHLDDFGTGYAGMGYVKRFPLDAIKLDRSFVAGLTTDRVDQAIVAAATGLAQALDMMVVAEGIETHEQRDALRALGADHGQGFLFGRPMPAGDLAARLRRSDRCGCGAGR